MGCRFRLFFRSMAVLAGAFLTSAGLFSQELTTGMILGLVQDSSGLAIPKAEVTVTNVAIGATRTVTTGETGEFSIPGLPPALYDIKVEKQGFRTYLAHSQELKINQVLRLTVPLEVGTVTETVTVSGQAGKLDTDTASLDQTFTTQSMTELPLNGRNLVQLAALSAGVSPRQFQRSTQYGTRNEYVTIEGGRDSSTNYLIDGVMVRSLRFNNLSIQPSVDTIQEFKVNQNSFSAEFGQGQSVITAVTKSGTNSFHGDVYEFLRNDKLDARNFFDSQKPAFRRNQFGGTGGGTIVPNRVFFFAGYEGLRTVKGKTFLATVPDPALLMGNLSSIGKPVIDPLTGVAFPGNIIPANRISHFAGVFNKYYPAPDNPPPSNWRRQIGFTDNYDQFTFRFDENLNSRNTLYERYLYYDAAQNSPDAFNYTAYPQSGQNFALGETFTITPSVVNEFKAGYNRSIHFILPVNPGGNPLTDLGIQNLAGSLFPIDYGTTSVAIAGYSNPGNGTITQGSRENVYSLADTISKVFNRHTLRAGIEEDDRRFNQLGEVSPRGALTFNGQYTGNAIADYLLGYPSQAQGGFGYSNSDYRSYFTAFFVQDDFRVSRRLTLNLGVRYEYAQPYREKHNQEGYFDPKTGLITFHVVPSDIPPSMNGLYNPQGGLVPAGIIQPDKNNWAPRIGLAWRPIGENTVIRAGLGIYYDNTNLNELNFTRLIPPFYGQYTLIGDAKIPNIFVDQLFPSLDQIVRFPAPFSVDPGNRTPYAEEYNFNIERKLPGQMVVQIGYAGSESHKLWKRYNLNQAAYDPTNTIPLTARLPYPQFDPGILTSANDANGHFDSFAVRLEKYFSNGFNFLTNYTFAKVIDNGSGEVDANDTADRNNKRLDRGRSNYDQRHRFLFSGSYQLPFGAGKPLLSNAHGVGGYLVSAWNVETIVSLLSGQPFTVSAAVVHNTGSYVPQHADRLKNGALPVDQRTPNDWLDLTAFAQPALGTQGTGGRNILDGPGIQDFDIALLKDTQISGDRIRLQFRAEFFDIFNRPNFGFPDANVSDKAFGVITTAQDGRDIQFGLKLIW